MKKSTKAMLFSLCMSPVILMTACVAPPSYTITASSSDISLGYVKGFDKQAMQKGQKVTISAISTSDSPFLCWIKDNKLIVSKEEKLNLTYNNKNEGHYTALFKENDITKMQYANLVDFSFSPSGYTKVDYEINTALLTSGSSDYYNFTNGSHTIGDKEEIQSNSVLYFGGIGDEYIYLIKLNLKLHDNKSQETSFEYTLQTNLNNDDFNNKGELVINEEVELLGNAALTLKFEKLNFDEVESK